MCTKGELMLTLESALIFPWDTLRTSHVLTETVSHPWVALEVLAQPINVLDFHLWGGYRRLPFYEHLVGFSAQLPHFFVLLVIEDWLSEPIVVSVVPLAWHTFLRLLLLLR